MRYYYGTGPGTGLASTMMLPYLNNLVQLAQGPGITGTYPDRSTYTLPDLIMAFANDGQFTEFSAAVGVFDEQTSLSGTAIPLGFYITSHFVSMRSTVALERLNCNCNAAGSTVPPTTSTSASTTASPTFSAGAANCNHDNCLRQFLAVTPFCATYTAAINTTTTSLPSYVSQCSGLPSWISSAAPVLLHYLQLLRLFPQQVRPVQQRIRRIFAST